MTTTFSSTLISYYHPCAKINKIMRAKNSCCLPFLSLTLSENPHVYNYNYSHLYAIYTTTNKKKLLNNSEYRLKKRILNFYGTPSCEKKNNLRERKEKIKRFVSTNVLWSTINESWLQSKLHFKLFLFWINIKRVNPYYNEKLMPAFTILIKSIAGFLKAACFFFSNVCC